MQSKFIKNINFQHLLLSKFGFIDRNSNKLLFIAPQKNQFLQQNRINSMNIKFE